MSDNIRDYGLPDSEPTSVPVATPVLREIVGDAACPNCGCKQLMTITLEVNQELLKGGKGKGTYIGCPACPFATPMAIMAG